MKKLMIAAAVAAMVGGAFADACEPEEEEIYVARVYQVQMNVYTTKGVMQVVGSATGASQCAPGESSCLVMRGRDKTVFRGYVYVCESLCELENYASAFCDSRRKALFGTLEDGEFSGSSEFAWTFCNVMGARSTDAECSWTFTGTVNYDEERAQEYALTGAGYGTFNKSTEGFFDNLGGYFAGTATASYDLSSRFYTTEEGGDACNCQPSQILKCDTVAGLEFEDSDTVAFGMWKMRFNANVTKAYLERGEIIFPQLLQKAMK